MSKHPAELCQTCGGSRLVMRAPNMIPDPCPECIAAGRCDPAPDGVDVTPMLVLDEMVVVRPAAGVTIPGGVPSSGLVMVGPGHVPGIGGVLRIVLVDANGQQMAATFAAGGLARFSGMVNAGARRLQSGEFDTTPAGASVQ